MLPINPRRNKAFLIDLIIYFGLLLIPFALVDVLPPWIGGRVSVLGLLLGAIYIVFRDGVNGQSIGKRLLKIQLVHKANQKPIGFGTALTRGILTSLPILSWIDFGLTVFTPDSQRYTDKLLRVELISK